ncbi:hypothetical protein B6A10_16160 [Flavobacterium sp. L1I52]|uniref:Outer membrane protein beta-barrel domain-containing protein n=1 Tax=Flavobacterium pokkalii TaxID=1940408 RepID=A0ABR7UUU9_9FLAO|nr:outer membrane beta-barrel protein [Flavobacterium pokkalii]MBD0726706.1 hypothetical protein [Flavobacterium pokkalii]
MNFSLKNAIWGVALLISQGISAQLYVGVQSGIGNIQNDVSETSTGNRLGAAVKVGYIYSLTNHIGIGTGLEFSQYKQEASLINNTGTLSSYQVDPSTSAFVYDVTTTNYNEKQTLHALQIPLFVQYKTNINKGIDFNFRAGAKYFLPLKYKMEAKADYVNGTAYYPDVNLYIDDLPEYGFGGQGNYTATGEYDTKGVFMSMFELGFTFDMGVKNSLYAAMFLENGYGSILDQKDDKSFIGYNPNSVSDRKANGLYSADKDAKLRPVAFGITLGWNFK